MRTQGRHYLYKVVYDTLKNEILDNFYPHGIILPSEREISIRFDVDRTTVRKALEMLVTEGLVEKRAGVGTYVIYKQNGDSPASIIDDKLIGFFIVENSTSNKKIAQPFYSDLFYHVEDQCKKHAANVIYSTIKSKDDLHAMIANRGFSGIIFASKTEGDYVKIAEDCGIKVAQVLGYNDDRGLTIRYDSSAAGEIAINYLIKRGHQNIAIITGPGDFSTTTDRMMGVLFAMYKQGLNLRKNLIFEGNWEYESGYNYTRQIIGMKNRPTAIYCFNDMMAIGAMQAIKDSGLNVPGDISLVGSDNMSIIHSNGQLLTTTDTNIPTLASIAIDYFFNNEAHYISGTKIIIPVTFIEGETVRDLRNQE